MNEKTKQLLKRLPIALVVLCVLAAVLSVTAFAGANDAQIAVDTAEADAGSSVTLPVTISQNPGFAAIGLEFSFNEEVLTLTSVTSTSGDSTAIINMTTDLNTKKSTYFNDEANVTANGVLCYLTFAVSENAAAGSYPVTVGLIESKPSNFVNFDFENVAVDFTAGSVTVAGAAHEHSFGDNGFCGADNAYDPDATAYTVTTAAQLKSIADGVNAGDAFTGRTVTLANDISLAAYSAWTPIGGAATRHNLSINSQEDLDAALEEHFLIYDSAGNSYVSGSHKNGEYVSGLSYYYVTGAAFAGTLDGAGYTVSDLTVNTSAGYAGFFGNLNGTVKDLTVSGSVTSTTNQDFVGGISGKLSAGGTIEGCVSNVTVTAASAYNVGGITGFVGEMGKLVSDTNPMATVKNCQNNGTVSGSNRTGGIAGRNAGTIEGCVNTGAVNNRNNRGKGTGGITGFNGVNNDANDAGIVLNCYNLGEVDCNTGYYSGGLVGFNNGISSVKNSYNAGKLKNTDSWCNPVVGHNEGPVSDCLFLNESGYTGNDANGVGNSSYGGYSGTATNVVGKTADDLKAAASVAFLNGTGNAWSADNATDPISNGYPILAWQASGGEDFIIEASDFVEGVYTLSQAGDYTVKSDAAGLISVTATGAVKLTGEGETGKVANLSVKYTVAGADLTIKDLWIDRPVSDNSVPVIDFTGTGNKLYFSGQNYLQCSNSYSAASSDIHVGPGTALTIDGDGELSLYAGSGGSCIGGADEESNGDITINGGTIYAYSSRAASTIGSGQKVDASGTITINGGELYLFGNARGACIGSGGMSSNRIGNGAPVTVTGGNLTNYVSFTGSAIGNGGGQQAANNTGLDPAPDPGTLTVSGGSIKTVMLKNSFGSWGLSGDSDQINDIAITAAKKNAAGDPVYLLTLPLEDVAANDSGDPYVVTEGSATLYSGDLTYSYTANTYGMWTDKTADANLYLYLSGEDHTLNVNGTDMEYEFNSADNTFALKQVPAGAWDGTVDTSWYNTEDNSFTLSNGAQLAGLAAIVNGTAEGIDQDPFKGKTVLLGDDIDLGADISNGSTSYTVTVSGGGTKTYTIKQASADSPKWTPIGNATYAFKGTFDGQGHKIEGLYVSATTSYLGLFGSVGGTDSPGAAGYGVVRNFTLDGLVENTNASAPSTDYVGAVAGKLNAGGTVSDVINYADVEAKNTMNVGGIAGFSGSPVGGANDGTYTANPSGYNTFILRCGNEALIHGYYKLGGIVGENASTVMYCYNKGFILPHMHGSGGGWGGIAGRNTNNNTATEEGIIAYCYNRGTVTNEGMNDDKNETIKGYGGIAGSSYGAHGHTEFYNCYSAGAQGAGRNNYNAVTTNLEGKARQGAVHDNYSVDADWLKSYTTDVLEVGVKKSVEAFKATTYGDDDILTLLGPYYTADTNNSNDGYPVLRWQAGKALPTPTAITVVTPPTKVAYSATQTFDPTGMVVKAVFDDNSAAIVSSDVEYTTDPLAAGTTSITLSYTFNGATVTATQAITVDNLSLDSIAVTTGPTKTIYAAGETFDKTGMVITASFNEGAVTRVLEAEEYVVTPDPLTEGLTEVTVSYTYASADNGEQTKTATQAVKVMAAFPEQDADGFYELKTVDDMLWFTDQVGVMGNRAIKGKLMNDIDLSAADWQPIGGAMNAAGTSFTANNNTAFLGEFDGNGKTLSVALNAPSYAYGYRGIFAYLSTGSIDETTYTAYVHDLTVEGSVSSTGASNIAGVAAYNNGGIIENCVNKATVISNSSYAAGVVAYVAGGGQIRNCQNLADVSGGSNAGGVAAYINNGIVDSCVNYGNISGSSTIGGVAGYATNAASRFIKCANLGDVTATGATVGGIVGQMATANSEISQCFNTGAVKGTQYVGGIAGTNSAKVTDCYNKGAVTGTSTSANVYMASGGIAGSGAANSAYTNTYNSGSVTAANGNASGIVGASNNAAFTITNSYWLEGTAEQAYLERTAGRVTATDVAVKTSDELKALAQTLGDSFKDGATYPILTWQADETLNVETSSAAGVVTAEVTGTPAIGGDILIDARTDAADATEAKVNIAAATAAGLGQANSLTVLTDLGAVTFDSAALQNIDAKDPDGLLFDIKLVSSDDKATVYDLTLKDGVSEEDVFTAGNAEVKLAYELAEGKPADAVQLFYLASATSRTQVPCSYADGYVDFSTTHFSTYSIEANAMTILLESSAQNVNAGGTFTVDVVVTGEAGQQFASLNTKVNYDGALVKFAGFEAAQGTSMPYAVDNTADSKITILEIGNDKTLSASGRFVIGTITFQALDSAPAGVNEAVFSASDATVGISGDPNPAATALTGEDLKVNIANITVTFAAGDGVTAFENAVAYAKYGEAGLYADNTYTESFTIPTVTAQSGYTLADAYWSDGENSYTDAQVLAKAFTESITLTASASRQQVDFTAPDDITVTGGVTDDGKATNGTPVTFTLADGNNDGYDVEVTYQVGDGDPVTLTPDENGVYTIPGDAITGPVTVTVTKTVDGTITYISYDVYKGAPAHYKVAVLTLDSEAPAGSKYLYDGQAMYWAQPERTDAAYGAGSFVYFVDSAEVEEETLAKITISTGDNEDVDYDGDVNESGRVEVNDAQMVYDLYNNNSRYSNDFSLATMMMRFEADVNGDGKVGVDDVRILYNILLSL